MIEALGLWGRVLLASAGVLGAAGVALGAAGAHLGGGEFGRLASDFLLFHAAAIPGLLALSQRSGFATQLAASMMAVGAACFSGDLAYLGFVGHTPLSGLAPFGGLVLIAAWLVLAGTSFAALRHPTKVGDKTNR